MDMQGAANAISGVFGPSKQPLNPKARDQSLPFMFEVSGGDVTIPERFVLPLNPESLRISWPTRTNITHTKASAFQDNIGLGLPSFSLQGTFGYRGTLDKGNAARSLSGEQKSAFAMYQEMEAMLLKFYARFGTYKLSGELNPNPVDPSNPPLLNFFDFTDRYFYVVQLNKFDLLRNTQRKFLYQYDIQMTGLKRVSAPMSEDALAAMLKKLDKVDSIPKGLAFVKGALALYSAVSNAITSVLNTIDSIKDAVDKIVAAVKAFRNGITKLIKAAFSLVTTVVKAVDSIIKTIVSITDIPHEIVNACREMRRALIPVAANQHLFTEDSTGASTTAVTDGPSQEIITVTLAQNSTAAQAYQMDTPEDTLFAPNSEIVREVSVREVSVTDNDTIYSIAQNNGVDWQQLASLNGLEYPFIAKSPWDLFSPALEVGGSTQPITAGEDTILVTGLNPEPGDILVFSEPGTNVLDLVSADVSSVTGNIVKLEEPIGSDFSAAVIITRHDARLSVLKTGSKVQIPGNLRVTTPITGNITSADTYAQLFGTDEELDGSGDQNADSIGDIRGVSGMSNLEMQLRHRLMTKRGELAQVGHPQYGSLLPTFIGQTNIPVMQERALYEAEITILADPRIRSVENAVFVVDNTAIFYKADIYPINQSNATRISLPLADN
jgi:hypothetical protein